MILRFGPPLTAAVLALAFASQPSAQPAPAADPPNSPAVQRHVDAALRLAGPRLAPAAAHQCRGRPNIPAENRAAVVPPARVFDNVYYVGMGWVGAWAIDTSDGLVLVDTLQTVAEAEQHIVGGLKALGVDPARIKYIVLTHNHGDHIGGAAMLAERYGARIITSAPEWEVLAAPPSGGSFAGASPPPKRDLTLVDGQTLSLGDATFTFKLTPGHTPGSVSIVFPAKEGGRTYLAAIVGGVTAQPNVASQTLALEGLRRFSDWTRQAGVEVELVDHPHVDNSLRLLQAASSRKPGEPNPFVIGREGFQNFLGMLMECYQGNIARLEGR